MRKPVLVGGCLGLLVLALFAVGSWLYTKAFHPTPIEFSSSERKDQTIAPLPKNPTSSAINRSASKGQSSLESQERRRRLAEVRAELDSLRTQGAQPSPQKMRALVDELEVLSSPGFDPRYFEALRNMLDASIKVQALNEELQRLVNSSDPKDAARREVITRELRSLGDRVQIEAKNLQSYATAQSRAKKP
ncbi:hypothetical protein QF021_001887 [Acidovorax delafieldii]|uniref:hypothetical protein n=1 Tax=Acidovorax delafieldii TaxID=47920 RepID=UPI00285F972E|nr:hypothetical protein [Acidovorax delafieldii]MDR6153798.1 hypothetical protein [Acidovorax delafieldii]